MQLATTASARVLLLLVVWVEAAVRLLRCTDRMLRAGIIRISGAPSFLIPVPALPPPCPEDERNVRKEMAKIEKASQGLEEGLRS